MPSVVVEVQPEGERLLLTLLRAESDDRRATFPFGATKGDAIAIGGPHRFDMHGILAITGGDDLPPSVTLVFGLSKIHKLDLSARLEIDPEVVKDLVPAM
jgi:hypothetical protein